MPAIALALQIGLLALIAALCGWLSSLGGLPVPGNVLGIILLYFLLCSGLLPERLVSRGAAFLLRHLVFFFIPIAVGLMNFGDVFLEHGLILLCAIIAGTLAPILTVIFMARWTGRRP